VPRASGLSGGGTGAADDIDDDPAVFEDPDEDEEGLLLSL
jgi:hypothetical protein